MGTTYFKLRFVRRRERMDFSFYTSITSGQYFVTEYFQKNKRAGIPNSCRNIPEYVSRSGTPNRLRAYALLIFIFKERLHSKKDLINCNPYFYSILRM